MPGSEHILEIIYLIATALFILSLKWMSSPTTARHGVWAGELGMLLAVAGTLLDRGIVDYKWIAIALVLGTIIGVPLGTRAHDRGAAADRAEPRVWRALRHARRHFGILFAHAGYSSVCNGGAWARSDSWLAYFYRKLDGYREAAGNFAAAADHL